MPAWEASIVQGPMATSVTVAPETVQDAGVVAAKLTASPELADAASANAPPPKARLGIGLNVIIFPAGTTMRLRVTSGAARTFAVPGFDAVIVHWPMPSRATVVPATEQIVPVEVAKVVMPAVAVADSVNEPLARA